MHTTQSRAFTTWITWTKWQRRMLLALAVGGGWGLLSIASAQEYTVAAKFLQRRINLDLWGKNLSHGYQQITRLSNVDIVISPDSARPKEFPSYTLYMEGKNVSVEVALEWLSRSIGMRYRGTGEHAVLITGSYDWMRDRDRKMIIQSVESLIDPEAGGQAFLRDVFELVKVYSLFPKFSVRLEEDGGAARLVASLPKTLKDRLALGLKLMARPGQAIAAPSQVTIPADEADMLRRLQNPVVVRYRNLPLRDILSDITLQAGFGFALDPQLFAKRPLPKITLNLGSVTTRKAIEALMAKAKIPGVELYPGGGLWFTPRPHKWERAASREIIWEKMAVRSYACLALAESFGGGEAIAHYLRREVHPDSWLDPSTAVIYHEKSGNLIVFAPRETQRAVERALAALAKTEIKAATPLRAAGKRHDRNHSSRP